MLAVAGLIMATLSLLVKDPDAKVKRSFSSKLTDRARLLPATGTKPPGELQIPPPPDPEPAGQAVLHARLQVGLFGRAGPRRPAPSPPWPGAGHRANHEERARGLGQRQQQPQQPRYSAHHDQPQQRGELREPKLVEGGRGMRN